MKQTLKVLTLVGLLMMIPLTKADAFQLSDLLFMMNAANQPMNAEELEGEWTGRFRGASRGGEEFITVEFFRDPQAENGNGVVAAWFIDNGRSRVDEGISRGATDKAVTYVEDLDAGPQTYHLIRKLDEDTLLGTYERAVSDDETTRLGYYTLHKVDRQTNEDLPDLDYMFGHWDGRFYGSNRNQGQEFMSFDLYQNPEEEGGVVAEWFVDNGEQRLADAISMGSLDDRIIYLEDLDAAPVSSHDVTLLSGTVLLGVYYQTTKSGDAERAGYYFLRKATAEQQGGNGIEQKKKD